MYTLETTAAFRRWLHKLKDAKGRIAVLRRMNRAEKGNFGDHKPVGQGVCEMRIATGPGYRVYYTLQRKQVVLLLIGGDKSSQPQDIKQAKAMAMALGGDES